MNEVIDVMKANIGKALDRGDKLEDIEARSGALHFVSATGCSSKMRKNA